jgi:predicted NBD/HSP70 family sugar kinase
MGTIQRRNPSRLAAVDAEPVSGRNTASEQRLSGTNLERVGDHNYRVTLLAVRMHDSITRTKLAALTGLTAPSIANITNRLLREGLIVDIGKVQGLRGQPPMLFAINPDGCFSIGVNIDRDHLTVVLLDLAGRVRARRTLESDFVLPKQAAAFFAESVKKMLANHGVDAKRVVGAGVAVPDRLSQIGAPKKPKNYAVWDSANVKELFGGVVGGEVFVENDATAAALGELQFGHGLHQPSFFYILISAGLGGGLVIDGALVRGAHGHAGELGFFPLKSRRTTAADLGQEVSLQGLYEALHDGGVPVTRPDALASLPAKGQRIIEDWLDLSADLLLNPLIAVSCLVDPQAVFIGGRLPPDLVDGLVVRLNKALAIHGGALTLVPVRRAALGVDAPVIGAALLPFNHRLLPSRAALMKCAEH